MKGNILHLRGVLFCSVASKAFFVRRGFEVPASFSFPTKCQGQFWRDSYVILRVPRGLEPGNYSIRVVKPDGQESNEVEFTVTGSDPGPGVCWCYTR